MSIPSRGIGRGELPFHNCSFIAPVPGTGFPQCILFLEITVEAHEIFSVIRVNMFGAAVMRATSVKGHFIAFLRMLLRQPLY